MYIVYFDETGDDGYPQYSSDLFILTSLYMHHQTWKDNYSKIKEFRRELKNKFNLPIKTEFHTKAFLTDKNPYRNLNISNDDKKYILNAFFQLTSSLSLKFINIVINKENIDPNKEYDILDKALTYNIQRIENDLGESEKFIIITDDGRVQKMTKTTRKIQRINYIPSKYNIGSYNRVIKKLIEDPLLKRSSESYFIQLVDMVSYIVFLYAKRKFSDGIWASRVLNILGYGDEIYLLNLIKNVLNLEATAKNEFGIVHYPKQKAAT